MAVPDTNDFNLQDVVDEINPTTDDLVQCFAEAEDIKFDPEYKVDKTNLYNFRNYGGGRWITIRPYLSYTKNKTLRGEGINWLNVMLCGVGWNWDDPTNIEMSASYGGGNYKIERGFLIFDTRGLEGTAIEAELHSRRVQGTTTFHFGMATWDDPLTPSEACSGTGHRIVSGDMSNYSQSDSSIVYKRISVPGDMSVFNTLFMGATTVTPTELGIINDYDNDPPLDGQNFYFWAYKGNNISQSIVWNNELRIKYWGDWYISAYPDSISKLEGGGSERIFVTATDGFTWTALPEDEWITISGSNTAAGSYKFEAVIAENTAPNPPRSGKIWVGSGVDYYYYINIEQDGTRLTASPNPWYAAKGGDNKTAVVLANSTNSWTTSVILGDSFLHITPPGTGTGEGAFVMYVDSNPTSYDRQGQIKIESDADDYILYVTQYGT